MTRTAPDCSLAPCQDFGSKSLETPIECEHCHAKVPATVAFTFEGADYIHYFCGPRCISTWCRDAAAHEDAGDSDFSYLRPWLDKQERFALSVLQADPRADLARQMLAVVAYARQQLVPSKDSTANYVPTKEIVEELGRLRLKAEQQAETPAETHPTRSDR